MIARGRVYDKGSKVEGVVDHTNAYGIWVNVGAEVIGRLNIARKYTDQLSAGQYLPDVVVERAPGTAVYTR
ncbi:hypothetical protein AK812_SmicGene45224 [Symbiodinium microadriaticum]|uniref:Uncharacterized protein n=1 Tax=Symbiodinium microadriaticum TaxID=2951 RepID=A0A1Q9BWM9_SYMMI|nr:hypothetical protein AK812_SmicGene45224 [Symbiodinium microadriaticum]